MERTKRDKWIDWGFFAALLLAVSAVTLLLFYRQTTGSTEHYHSDMKAYILEMQGLDSGYSFPYPVFFRLGALIHLFAGPELSVAIATMLLNSLGMVCVKLAFNYQLLGQLRNAFSKHSWTAGILVSLASVSLFFISMLFPPDGIYLPGIKYNYLGVFTSNPFHNATYMAARPFAVLAFFQYAKLLDCYEQGYGGKWSRPRAGVAMKDYVLLALFLLLATMTKPSFTIVLVGTAGLIMLCRLIRAAFRSFVPTVQLGLCFVPTFVDLLYQYKGVFVPEEGAEGGMGFGFGEVWSLYCDNIPLAVCLAVGCPLLAALLHGKELKGNTLYRFSWQIYWMSFAMAFFLYEKGFRRPDFNFSWGYMYGIFFCFLGTVLVLLKDTASVAASSGGTAAGQSQRGPRKKVLTLYAGKKLLLGVQWLAYLWHLVCGLYYFWGIFRGGMYY